MRYTYKNTYKWSPEIAYVVGLFASDGCLFNDNRHLNITSKDMEIINNVRQILDVKAKTTIKMGQFNTPAHNLTFGNVAFYDFLVKIGLTPAKSKTIGPLDIPDEFYFDFLRGEFDGDGCIRGFMDVRWANSLMFYIEFASASLPFLQFIQATNTRLANTTSAAIKPGKALTLSYAKHDSIKLAAAMYYPRPLPSLTRKRRKLFDFITRHQNAIIRRNWKNARVL